MINNWCKGLAVSNLYSITVNPTGSAVAHGGNPASSYNGGHLRNGLAPQDRAASLVTDN